MWKIFLILLVLITSSVKTQELSDFFKPKEVPQIDNCQDYINTAINSIVEGKLPPLSTTTIMNSGKGINDLGGYIVCTDNKEYRYFTLALNAGAQGILSVGLCLPSFCHQSDLQPYEAQTADIINGLISTDQAVILSAQYQDPTLVYPKFGVGATLVSILFWGIIFLNISGILTSYFFPQQQRSVEPESFKKDSKISTASIAQNEHSVVVAQTYSYMNDDGKTKSDDGLLSIAQEVENLKPRVVEPMFIRILRCFSLCDNFNRLFTFKKSTENFDIFNGMRALSIFWVIYGHDYMVRFFLLSNPSDAKAILEAPGWISFVPPAYFAVDVFFFIGGILAAVIVTEKLAKLKTIRAGLVPAMWLHRFLRIWPTYAVCLLVYWKYSVYWTEGPIWDQYIQKAQLCNTQFWRNLLLIDNLFHHGSTGLEYCFGWGWYLSNDFQIFLITPFLLILHQKRPKIGIAVLTILFIGSIVTAYVTAWTNDYHVNIPSTTGKPQLNYQDNFYYKPWIRITPYIMGLFVGLLYREYSVMKNKRLCLLAHQIQTSISIRCILYLVGIGLTLGIILMCIPLQKNMDAWPHQLHYWFQALNRVVFVLGVFLCILPALLGVKNDPAKLFLSHNFWVPIARVSFCIYLVQLPVIQFTAYGSTQINYFQSSHMLFFILTDIFYSIIVGGLLSLTVEVPFMNIEKILFAQNIKS